MTQEPSQNIQFKDFNLIHQGMMKETNKLRNDIPSVMESFAALANNATADGALSKKFKELIALAISVSKQCEGCIAFHSKNLVKLGVSREELVEMLGMVIYMNGGPGLVYASQAIGAFDQFSS